MAAPARTRKALSTRALHTTRHADLKKLEAEAAEPAFTMLGG
jgi:hypothetical protein